MGHHPLSIWVGFTAAVGLLLILDLAVLTRRAHVLKMREALLWSGSLISCALLFGLFVLWREGVTPALEYYTGYLIELSLSVDNLFVFILIFQYFRVPAEQQPRVLKWGILGAIVMRLIMIMAGSLLFTRFDWVVFVFGAILLVTGIRMFRSGDGAIDLEHNRFVRLVTRVLPFSRSYHGSNFFVTTPNGWMATPLFLVLIIVEWSDLVFAIDSIPAIFAITRDPFLVYSSNIFAILGLRALFFVLSGMVDRFRYLKPGVAIILAFVGTKMILSHWVHIPVLLSLGVILGVLATAVGISLTVTARES